MWNLNQILNVDYDGDCNDKGDDDSDGNGDDDSDGNYYSDSNTYSDRGFDGNDFIHGDSDGNLWR